MGGLLRTTPIPFFVSLSTIEWGGVGLFRIGLGAPRRGLFSHERGRLTMAAAAATVKLGNAVKTTMLDLKGIATESLHDAVYRLEVYSLDQIDKRSALKYLNSSIREQAGTTCKGAVNPAYVGEQFSENDFLFKSSKVNVVDQPPVNHVNTNIKTANDLSTDELEARIRLLDSQGE